MSVTNSWLETLSEPENPCVPDMITNGATNNNWLLWFMAGAVVVLVLKNGKKGA